MPENKIPLCSIIGVNLIAMCLLAFAIAATLYQQNMMYPDEDAMYWVGANLLLGGVFLLTGMGMMMKMKGARIALNILLLLCFSALAFGVYSYVEMTFQHLRSVKNTLEELCVFLFIFLILSGSFLFVNNEKVVGELNKNSTENG